MIQPQDILEFWFPPGLDADEETHRKQFQFWFGGGANSSIAHRFADALEAAACGELDGWAQAPRSRLALIIVLDQFSRSLHRDSAQAYTLDEQAIGLAVDGLECGFYDRLSTVWEKTFFVLPLGHSEQLALSDRCVLPTERLAEQAPGPLRRIYAFSASQARGSRDVLARFGRQPHRNALLGRESTEEERAYVAAGDFVHRRSFKG